MKRQFDDLLLGSIELFCLAAEHGSFTAAAALAGVTPGAVSRSVSRLEQRLGVRLFVRTTRQIRLTDGGQTYFDQCRQALTQLVDAENQVTGRQTAPSGHIRISLPVPYAHYRILPLLSEFRAQYPDVTVETHVSNRNIDFIEEGYDLAIRGRLPADSSMIGRKLEDAPLVIVATPGYVARRGTPQTPADLAQHDCIQFDLPSSGREIPWLIRQHGTIEEFPTQGGYRTSGDYMSAITLARKGAGLFQTYRFIVEDDLRSGALVEVLSPYAGGTRAFSLLYPHGRHLPLRVRVFIDFLIAKLAD